MKVSHFSRIYWSLAFAGFLAETATALAAEPGPFPVVQRQPIASTAPLTNLVFDSEHKDYAAKSGEAVANFVFQFTNTSEVAVHIIGIHASCSCTKADMPETPWIIPAHTSHQLHATMQLVNKAVGETTKYLTLSSTNGTKQLWVKSIIAPPAANMSDREKNQLLAKADRQAVFKNDCASCHADKSKGLMGAALYQEACGICHDSDHRASMVPDLRALNHPTDANFWRLFIAEGKENTLMPAFSQERGGPLTKEQINSLVEYLTTRFPFELKMPSHAKTSSLPSLPAMRGRGPQTQFESQ
jgi:mono/diheme cytochrome c family protein